MTDSGRAVAIPLEPTALSGALVIPPDARGLVLFAHGSGSSRLSPRNRYVAEQLQKAGLATLLFDLLTPEEEAVDERTRALRFNIRLLADRLWLASHWMLARRETEKLNLGYFGASTGAAAALIAAAEHPHEVSAVVSRGGRPDLAAAALVKVKAPTLLIVGGWDEPVITMNQQALAQLQCEKELVIVPGATHLFEEAGKLGEVAQLATHWFSTFLKAKTATY